MVIGLQQYILKLGYYYYYYYYNYLIRQLKLYTDYEITHAQVVS